ncbi:MAG TPA: methionine adenosyltransferase, partial [Burkholderiales bacterium]|nr:methionine adenosyltransferase [Burkholderiales bacterium]
GLSRFYLERFGAILHHNVDKALLIAGAARPAFGGGELVTPIEITLAGRATRRYQGVTVPVDEMAVELSRVWISRHLRYLDPERDVRIVPRIGEASPDLASLFLRRGAERVPLANDTSFGVGFAPLDRLERAVLAVDAALRTPRTLREHPEIGDDVKLMGVRAGTRTSLTVACAFVGRHVRDLADYRAKKARLARLCRHAFGGSVDVEVNAADGDTADSIYLTASGLSAEGGDDGQVGRGNRVNGLITPYRPMSLEATAGKNPQTHTGKLYNLLAERIAQALVREVAGVSEAYCWLLSRIGSPLSEPQLADVRVRLVKRQSLRQVRRACADVIRAQLETAGMLWRQIVA